MLKRLFGCALLVCALASTPVVSADGGSDQTGKCSTCRVVKRSVSTEIVLALVGIVF